MRSLLQTASLALGLWGASVRAIDVTWTDESSIKEAAGTIAYGLVKYYTGNNTGDVPGNLPDPYYWWEAGAMFGALIDYWWMTDDDSYNNITSAGMLHQVGEDEDFMPTNQTRTEGNDDQGFWAMAAMAAAERKFPDPPDDEPQWLALAQAVFNEYASRWDTEHCDGGMRWQIFQFNSGYNYKNTISNGCFFNIAARLARYTGNDTYSDWATKIWKWERGAGLITDAYKVYDGVTIGDTNCSSVDTAQWSYNAGIFLHGASVMYNLTESSTWKTRMDGMLSEIVTLFVKSDVIFEHFCEQTDQCNQDQQSFKGYLGRWLAATSQMAPYTYETIYPLLLSTAKAAVAVCTGTDSGFKGHSGTACGFSWLTTTYDGLVGVGSQMNAMSMVMYTLVKKGSTPVTSSTGGTSEGNADAGNKNSDDVNKHQSKITTADRAGAAIITILMCGGVLAGTAFVLA
ncbi:Mannan endo-1,6-alpha-mannosidase DCW1 [Neonectria ditissima]|uniref:Mannan endo-1,6-alpha-mannosidase n=1 Tax=Neonectria ditissima TaxID=78410 RepID=A0A0P7B3S3_9HYPO|nr:Mannan endo-1,6-alpha-mannosidase DCW1 [Neonectria ditissima]